MSSDMIPFLSIYKRSCLRKNALKILTADSTAPPERNHAIIFGSRVFFWFFTCPQRRFSEKWPWNFVFLCQSHFKSVYIFRNFFLFVYKISWSFDEKKSGQKDDFQPFWFASKVERANITARVNNMAPMVVSGHWTTHEQSETILE